MEPTSDSRTLNIFNDNLGTSPLSPQDGLATFPQFCKLLPELRIYIWKLCFPRRRVISITISQQKIPHDWAFGDDDATFEACYTTRNSLGNIVSTYPYRIHVPHFEQSYRVLEHVNRESRHEFCSLYRIIMPTNLVSKNQVALLRLSPDTDILEVQKGQLTPATALVAFFHDAVANDPAGRGIGYIAMGRNINDLKLLVEHTSPTRSERARENSSFPHNFPLHPVAAASMRQWLQTGLHTFYSVINPSTSARTMAGHFSWPSEGGTFHWNRSVPISAQAIRTQVTEYSSFGPDPRPIHELDLAHVGVGTDPRRNVYDWYRVMANLGLADLARSDGKIRFRYLMGIWPETWHVSPVSRAGFARFLKKVDGRFERQVEEFGLPPWGNRFDEDTWRKQQVALSDVAGLWVFDADAFEEIPSLDESVADSSWTQRLVKDFSGTRPELLVFHLP